MCVNRITNRTGYSNTSPRKMPTNTTRNVSPIARNAATIATAATTRSNVLIGMRISIRRFRSSSIDPRSTMVGFLDFCVRVGTDRVLG
jgi:hypothetical protein